MKLLIRYFILVIVFSSAYEVHSDCSNQGLEVFPKKNNINPNSIFIVEGYSSSQSIILGLNKSYPIYLINEKTKIKLLIIEICVGQFGLSQALLKPEVALEKGLEYTLQIDSLPTNEILLRYNRTTDREEKIKYKVVGENDKEKPNGLAKIQLIKKVMVNYGCGPAVYVIFNNPLKDNSDIIAKTTVKNLKTGNIVTYYLIPKGDVIKIGHGMCSGAFDFDDNTEYEVGFSFFDFCGNLSDYHSEKIKFTKPTQVSKTEDG